MKLQFHLFGRQKMLLYILKFHVYIDCSVIKRNLVRMFIFQLIANNFSNFATASFNSSISWRQTTPLTRKLRWRAQTLLLMMKTGGRHFLTNTHHPQPVKLVPKLVFIIKQRGHHGKLSSSAATRQRRHISIKVSFAAGRRICQGAKQSRRTNAELFICFVY